MTGHDVASIRAPVGAARDRWIAAHAAVFRELFASCGAAGANGRDASLLLTSLAGQFAWHAELLFDVLPDRDGVDREALVRDARTSVGPVVSCLEELGDHDEPAVLCVVLARLVVPRLAAALDGARRTTDARLEGPLARALLLIARDLADDLAALEAACARLSADAQARKDGRARVATLEQDLREAGAGEGVVAQVPVGQRG